MAYFTAKQYTKASKDWNNENLCNCSLFAIKDLMKDNTVYEIVQQFVGSIHGTYYSLS